MPYTGVRGEASKGHSESERWEEQVWPFKGSVQTVGIAPFLRARPGAQAGGNLTASARILKILEKGTLTQHLWAGHGELPCDPKAYRLRVLFGFRRDPSWLLTISVTSVMCFISLSLCFHTCNMEKVRSPYRAVGSILQPEADRARSSA